MYFCRYCIFVDTTYSQQWISPLKDELYPNEGITKIKWSESETVYVDEKSGPKNFLKW